LSLNPSMLPHSGTGVIWDSVVIDNDNKRAETTIFVPESKKLFGISISLNEVNKDDLNVTKWLQWSSVGVRDAVRPSELIGVTVMSDTENKPLVIEYTNQTTFKTTLLFPDRQDHANFVGEKNAWSYDVGIVSCGKLSEPATRGVYCVAYVERDYEKGSAFIVNEGSLKYPEGVLSTREQQKFEALPKMIDIAMEEASILAQKGRAPANYEPIVPAGRKPKVDDNDGFDRFDDNSKVVRTDVHQPYSWVKGKSMIDVTRINKKNDMLVVNRFHHIIVYKKAVKGFIGFTPRLGSLPIVADSLKNESRHIKIGDFLHTRVELNKRTATYVVEQIVEIRPPHHQIEITRDGELKIWVDRLEISSFTPVEGRNSRFDGYLEHPDFIRILCRKSDIEEWENKTVNAIVRHSENMRKENPLEIYLVLEQITGEFNELSQYMDSSKVPIVAGNPDDFGSDDDEDEDEEEKNDEGRYSDDER
ncbi:hypothetical protein PFISCL1PPCAC_14838, partial [Pristionchus fissidentatus]